MVIKHLTESYGHLWDSYVNSHPRATLYHLSGWKKVIERSYGHKTYYLVAFDNDSENAISGVLPLVHLKHFFFGNSLISIPFFDMGGILADTGDIEKELISVALELAKTLKAEVLEFRHTHPISGVENNCFSNTIACNVKSHKVRMLLELPGTSEDLMKSFKSKLRSQIKKPVKEGLQIKIGGKELIDDFYKVFLINMRDLGSPVHSRKLLKNVMETFNKNTKIILVHKGNQPYAGSIVSGFKDTLENPWASSLRNYSRLSPNMLLYWAMLEYACNNGYRYFDFGRSTPGEGTYRFKKQWGAEPYKLHWYGFSLKTASAIEDESEKKKFNKAIRYWQKLPVSVTEIIGPMIRKNIGL